MDYYKLLKELNYSAYVNAINFASGLIYNANIENNLVVRAQLEKDIVAYTYMLLR